jgi:hypothetical protein
LHTPQKAHSRVADQYRNLDDAWTNKTLRAQWLQLPLEAVERLLTAEALAAASENVVYIFLASWVSAQLKCVCGQCVGEGLEGGGCLQQQQQLTLACLPLHTRRRPARCTARRRRLALADAVELSKVQATAAVLLSGCRYSHMTGNFLAAVAAHHHLLANQPGLKQWLLEAMQWSKATEVQRKDMQVRVCLWGVLTRPKDFKGACVWSGRVTRSRIAER